MNFTRNADFTKKILKSIKEELHMKNAFQIVASAFFILAVSCSALAVDIETGTIWHKNHARLECPKVCSNAKMIWTGQWAIKVRHKTSVCTCVKKSLSSSPKKSPKKIKSKSPQ